MHAKRCRSGHGTRWSVYADSSGAGEVHGTAEASAGPVATREVRCLTAFVDLVDDVRHACRGLARTPGFTLIAVFALALGIGANAATFAYVDALSFRPLPVEEPERLVAVYGEGRDQRLLRFSYRDWMDYREGTATCSRMSPVSSRRGRAFPWTSALRWCGANS